MNIGGVTWFKADGFTGSTGDYDGSLSTGVAYIITDGDLGSGITNVSEPNLALGVRREILRPSRVNERCMKSPA